ncbi:SCP2 sterol-binding domain-containing protein [Methylocystis parvus]|uniref:4Fe-4S ferredoxin n=1 Tax=Methylocystis parvus TaxID=134 RepID=A0A6B8M0E7_9HYPH|nr:SCP2 sterol-binding domain-containing protein [Methylocystis parvus]QGM96311.1 4Fe-4S ferredoxin [Methylocystis parvus]WBJ99850.1 SCP2 sterol-binding domain-containing protein [Methylocystis parvus OBBP]
MIADASAVSPQLDAQALRDLAFAAGADDVGFVAIDDPALDDQRAEILSVFPFARTLISFVVKINRENLRSPARSLANHEFHHAADACDEVAHVIVKFLETRGRRAGYPPAGFPMEADNWPGKMWTISHKPVAVAAGLGRIGVHRNVIHPKFGNFILLGTVAVDLDVAHVCAPLDFNPCLECKLCVAACPTGAIAPDGHFDFAACYTHNYREFMGGFSDFVENIADARDARSYRDKVSDSETVSMWQSLAFRPNYKAAYCMAVCPAGEDVIGAYANDKKNFLRTIVDPLQKKAETIYVTKGSDADDYVARRFPNKRIKHVGAVLRPTNVDNFLAALRHIFQRHKAAGIQAVYHFSFTGARRRQATVVIADKTISVQDGLVGRADFTVTADGETWIRFLRKEASLPWALLSRRVKLRGDPRLLLAFAKCFPA